MTARLLLSAFILGGGAMALAATLNRYSGEEEEDLAGDEIARILREADGVPAEPPAPLRNAKPVIVPGGNIPSSAPRPAMPTQPATLVVTGTTAPAGR